MFGPDLVGMFVLWELHGIIGFAIIALPLALFYSYSSRFSIIKSEKTFFPLKLEDDGGREVNWKNAYYLTVAGGISHLLMDNLFYPQLEMELWPGFHISQMDLMTWFGTNVQVITPISYFLPNVLLVYIIILSIYTFKKGYKSTSQLFLIYIGLIIGLVIVSQATKEFGVIVFCVVYFLIPLFLLMYAARDVQDNPIKPSGEPKSNKKTQLNIVIIIGILLALFLIFYAYYVITSAMTLALQLQYYYPQDLDELENVLVIIGYITLIISIIYLFGLIGLFFKSNICRYIVIALSSYLLILAFPFAIALFLCEKDVKALFRKES